MIEFKTGDVLTENAEALVNSVNCVGVMGRGIALQFKKAFPDNFAAYAAACDREEVLPGRMFVYETQQITNPRYIINFPTKRHWRGRSRMADIDAGLEALANTIREREIRSIAIPPLGSGLGGLPWEDVRWRIARALGDLQDRVHVIVYEPVGAPAASSMPRHHETPVMTPPRATLVALMDRYLSGLLDPSMTLLEVHKLLYFMQEAGQPLRLRYQKAPYGPYADNLRHSLNILEGHFVSGYGDGGDEPEKEIELLDGAVEEANDCLAQQPEVQHRLERVGNLVAGFETAFGLELLATVHWVITKEGASTMNATFARVREWNDRKRAFSERQVELAAKKLVEENWISLPAIPAS